MAGYSDELGFDSHRPVCTMPVLKLNAATNSRTLHRCLANIHMSRGSQAWLVRCLSSVVPFRNTAFMSDALAYQIVTQVFHHQVAVCRLHTLVVDAYDERRCGPLDGQPLGLRVPATAAYDGAWLAG